MRRFFVTLAVIVTFQCFAYEEYLFYPQGEFRFTSYKQGPYTLSGFNFKNGVIYGPGKSQREVPIGTVEKLNEWTRAYVFKVGDTVLSTHRALLLSSGSFFDDLKMYEVYDENNQIIGFIEGVQDTDSPACFYFYKENHELFAKASLDLSLSKLTISTPDNEILITAKKTIRASASHNFLSRYDSNEYYWRIIKEKEQSFDALFLWPFMGFLSEVWWR